MVDEHLEQTLKASTFQQAELNRYILLPIKAKKSSMMSISVICYYRIKIRALSSDEN